MKPPQAIIRVVIDIGGETWPDIMHRLQGLINDAEREGGGEIQTRLWGGAGTHGHVEVTKRDDGCTPEQYEAELEAWFQERKTEKEAATA